jgi:hypothetical protein
MKQQPLTFTLFNHLILLFFSLSWLSPTFADDVNLDQIISLENASWELFTNRSNIQALALSADGKTLWVGTGGGLEQRQAETGELMRVFTKTDGLPDNSVLALLADGSGGLWVGTSRGLAHYQADGQWTVFNQDNSDLPSNYVWALLADGSGGLWVGTSRGGLAHLTFSQKNTLIQTIENEATRQELLTGERAAILIHPRGQGNGYNQEVSIQYMATHAYRTLHQRGYDHDEIYFLSHKPDLDSNGDGITDRNVVDGPVNLADLAAGTEARDLTQADVEQAFAWAKQQGTLTQPLLVVFIDHGLTGQLRLDPFSEVLTAADFNQLLTDYQQTTANSVVVILEACHTGSLIAGLSAPNRLIITSTATDQAYYDNLGQYSFSKFYFDNLRRGENYYQAFQVVKDKIATYGHPFAQQIPQLEDDGDGTASTSNDGRWAKQYCLNGCFAALAGEITLEADPLPPTVTPDQAVELSVRAGITEGRITRVWALVMTPEVAQQRNDQGFALLSTPVIDLKPSPTEQTRWQGQFSEFHYQGDYVITYMAKDNEGFITSTAPLTVTLPEGPKPQPRLVANKSTYHNGDKLEVTLPALPAEQNQHAAITLPDGTLFLLTEKNIAHPFDGNNLLPWTGNDMAIELPIDPGLPRGEYTLYLLRVPVGIEQPLTQPEQWILGVSTFLVE